MNMNPDPTDDVLRSLGFDFTLDRKTDALLAKRKPQPQSEPARDDLTHDDWAEAKLSFRLSQLEQRASRNVEQTEAKIAAMVDARVKQAADEILDVIGEALSQVVSDTKVSITEVLGRVTDAEILSRTTATAAAERVLTAMNTTAMKFDEITAQIDELRKGNGRVVDVSPSGDVIPLRKH
jgi:hypothetical protein